MTNWIARIACRIIGHHWCPEGLECDDHLIHLNRKLAPILTCWRCNKAMGQVDKYAVRVTITPNAETWTSKWLDIFKERWHAKYWTEPNPEYVKPENTEQNDPRDPNN